MITRNYQITIPKDIREKLNLRLGESLQLHMQGEEIVIERMKANAWEECSDFLPDNFDAIQERMREDATERFKRLGIL
ncbi:MAG TPA: AbrB/MazE/SpoVT family DNA-binding domain-containing protein [Candidatus Lokiarchaeia archaeon]|nr:AbrB/MazE/SpoVT family DNA-binding domain-containing protein [Candidatus Lokiarchaeia archaeon]